MKIQNIFKKVFLVLLILFGILMIGMFFAAIWVNNGILSGKFALTGVLFMFLTLASLVPWLFLYFD